jgi:hypothetical protein
MFGYVAIYLVNLLFIYVLICVFVYLGWICLTRSLKM